MHRGVTFLFLLALISSGTAKDLKDQIVDKCKVDSPRSAGKLLRYASPLTPNLIPEADVDLQDTNIDGFRDIRPGPRSAGVTPAATYAKDLFREFIGARMTYGGLFDKIRPKPDADVSIVTTTQVPEVTTEAYIPDETERDLGECRLDVDHVFSPLKQALHCSAIVVIRQKVKDMLGLKDGFVTDKLLDGFGLKIPIPEDAIEKTALLMIDASFKPPPGILQGKLHWPGDYDQCLDISSNYSSQGQDRVIQGGYCRVSVAPTADLFANRSISLTLGICIPDTCTRESIMQAVRSGNVTFPTLSKVGLEVTDVFCGREIDLGSDSRGLLALSITLILAIIALIAGFYDGLYRKSRLQKDLDRNFVPIQNRSQISAPLPSGAGAQAQKDPHTLGRSVSYINCHPEDYRRFSTGGGGIEITTAATLTPSASVSSIETLDIKYRSSISMYGHHTYLDEPVSFKERLEVAFVGFSIYTSMKNIFAPRINTDYFRSCDSIRFISYLYAMLGMSYVLGTIYSETFTTGNLLQVLELKKLLYFQPVLNFTLCIDSFLVLSGLLVTYNWLKRVAANDGRMTWRMLGHFYLHRYWSLMPAFMLVTMFYTCLYEYFTHGPMVPPLITDAENCRENWWTNLLMISNLVNVHDACMSWTWYIPLVFQLHVITPLILIPIVTRFRVIGYGVWLVLFGIHIAVTALISMWLYDNFGFENWYYDYVMVPWTKAGAYFIGVALGALLFKIRGQKIDMPWFLSVLGWSISILLVFLVSLSTWEMVKEDSPAYERWSRETSVLIRTVGHTIWGASVAWMILASETHNGGIIGSFLRYKGFGPLARMSFMAFLVSAIMIIKNTLLQVSLIYMTLNNMLYFFCGNVAISMTVGLALGLVFQRPWMGIEKAFTIRTKRDAYLVASNPLAEIGEERPHPELEESAAEASTNMYDNIDNIAYQAETPPPVYKEHDELRRQHTTQL